MHHKPGAEACEAQYGGNRTIYCVSLPDTGTTDTQVHLLLLFIIPFCVSVFLEWVARKRCVSCQFRRGFDLS